MVRRSFPAVCMPSPASTQTSWASLSFSCPTMPQSTPQEFPGWLAGTDPRREGHSKWNQYALQRNGLVTRVLRPQHTALITKGPLDEPSLKPSTPSASRPGAQSRGGLCPKSYSGAQELKPSQGLQGPFFVPCTNMCICLWVSIPFKGPPPAPHSLWHSLYPRTCSCWPACLSQTWAFCWLFPLLKSPSSTLDASFTPFPPSKLLLILQGPVNGLLLLQESFPDPQPNRLSPCLLSHHRVLLNHSDWELLEGRKQPLLSTLMSLVSTSN